MLAHIAREALLKDMFSEWYRTCSDMFVTYDVERQEREAELAKKLSEVDERLSQLKVDKKEAEEMHKKLPMDLMASLKVPGAKEEEGKEHNQQEGEKTDIFEIYRKLCQSEEPTTSLLPRYYMY